MQQFDNLPMIKKIALGFGVILAVLIIQGGVGISGFLKINEYFNKYSDQAYILEESEIVLNDFLQTKVLLQDYIINNTAERMKIVTEQKDKTRAHVEELKNKISDEDQEIFVEMLTIFDTYEINFKKFADNRLQVRETRESILKPGVVKLAEMNADLQNKLPGSYQNTRRQLTDALFATGQAVSFTKSYIVNMIPEEREIALAYSADIMTNINRLDKSVSPLMAAFHDEALRLHANILETLDLARKNSGLNEKLNKDGFALAEKLDEFNAKLLASQQELKEKLHNVVGMELTLAIITLIIASVLAVFLSLFIGRALTGALAKFTQRMRGVSEGDLESAIPFTERADEIGILARTLEVFRDNELQKRRLEEEQEAEQQRRTRMQDQIDQLLAMFGKTIGGVFRSLSQSANNMSGMAQSLEEQANKTSSSAESLTNESKQTAENVITVSSALEEANASSEEIRTQMDRSAKVSEEAVHEAELVSDKVKELSLASERVTTVLDLINDIAEQTNLLALNATIEAARAGDAGKGFAVVANEVKALANQTSKAIEDISQHIVEMQSVTKDTSGAILKISDVIKNMNEMTSSVATAVIEQQTAAEEISRSIDFVKNSAENVNEVVETVSSAARQSFENSGDVKTMAGSVSTESEQLSREVDDFLTSIREIGAKREIITYPANFQATLKTAQGTQNVHVIEISPGVAVVSQPLSIPPGTKGTIFSEKLGTEIDVRFAANQDRGGCLQFPMNFKHLEKMETLLRQRAAGFQSTG